MADAADVPVVDDGPGPAPVSARELFFTFVRISMQSFGGSLSIIERTIVVDKRWLTAREFLGVYGVSQVLPGPSGISFCVLLCDRFHGFRGAVAGLAGYLLAPAAIVIAVVSLFQHYEHVPQVQGAVHGMGAAAAGLIIATAARLARSLRGQAVGIVVATLSFIAVGLAHVPVGQVVLTIGLLSVLWAWFRQGP